MVSRRPATPAIPAIPVVAGPQRKRPTGRLLATGRDTAGSRYAAVRPAGTGT